MSKSQTPLLVASLSGDDLPSLLRQAQTELADVVEIRLDLWGAVLRDDLQMILEQHAKATPILLSFRGGHPLPTPEHWKAISSVAMIDVEWNPTYPWREISQQAKRAGIALMISHHDFKRTPTKTALLKIARSAYAKGADIFKVATQATRAEDLRTLLSVSQQLAPKKRVAVMGMGPMGAVSRLVAPLFHSAFVYGYIGTPTASGQWPYSELRDQTRALFPDYNLHIQKRQKKLQEARS